MKRERCAEVLSRVGCVRGELAQANAMGVVNMVVVYMRFFRVVKE